MRRTPQLASWAVLCPRRGYFARVAGLALVWLAVWAPPVSAVYEGFQLPNAATAAFPAQSRLFSQDFQIVADGSRGNGIVYAAGACAVLPQASPDMTVRLTTGCTIVSQGSTATVTTGNITIAAAHATLVRIDIVSVDNAGTKVATTGTAATTTAVLPPTIPQSGGVNNLVLAFVYVPAADTAINTNQITDKRIFVNTPGVGTGAATTLSYITKVAEGTLSNEFALGSLGTGLLINTTTTGVPTVYAGSGACTAGDFISALSATGVKTCGTPAGGGAPTTAGYWTKTADATLSNEQAMGALGTGVVINTTTTGVPTILAAQSSANQFVRSYNASATATFSSVGIADLSATGTPSASTFLRGDNTWSTPAGSGTVTATGGALTANAVMLGAGTTDSKVMASLGTTTTVLHGNAAGAPTFGQIAIADHSATGTPSATTFYRGDNTWATPSGGGGATLTTFSTARPADASSTLPISSQTTRNVTLFELPGSITVNLLSIYFTAITTAGTLRLCLYSEDGATKLVDISITPAAGVVSGAVSAVALTPGRYYAAVGCGASACNVTVAAAPAPSVSTLFGLNSPAGKPKWIGTVTHTSGTCNATLGTITGSNTAQAVLRGDN